MTDLILLGKIHNIYNKCISENSINMLNESQGMVNSTMSCII